MKSILIATLFAGIALAQKYTGPKPEKKDVVYLVHADNLVETEHVTARRGKKDDMTYTVAGDKSTAKTPLASPILVIDKGTLDPHTLQLFRFEVKSGHREVTMKKKGGAEPLRLAITPAAGAVYRIEVSDSLPPGEYGLSPDGSNDVFCFAVF